ncbi:DDB1- and CUL4-associated factor 6-like isoform X2 [Ornithodoros turicata]|uniref:DDB1- and CUL4-associated factor 6-like isoform X2 n=1 Tax=Ornithodoros turicata TaxID=34597 RepID=UPI003139849B
MTGLLNRKSRPVTMYGRRGLFWQIEDSSYGYSTPFQLFDAAKGSRTFVQKLSLQAKLPVHNGCVNTICWNDAGTLLLSGSDDQHLCITNGYSHEVVADIRTGHTANIFSAKFLPNTSDHLVVSCSGDGVIAYSDVERPETSLHNLWTCHFGTAYEIATVPNDPHSFLSCGEDGTVRWFDLRTKCSCSVDDCKEDILINCHRAVTSISVNPLTPYHLAVGCSDSTVRVFDRRMLGTRSTGNYMSNSLDAMVSRFTVPEFEGRGHRITSLTYSSNGREMLVSYSSDYIYLFDARDDGQVNRKAYGADSQASSTDGKPTDSRLSMKRLRVRGDWSDTGPNARPEREMRALGEQQPRSLHASLMQRMSDVLTRMFNTTMSRNRTALTSSSSASSAQSAGESSTEEEADAPTSRQSRRARIAQVLQRKFRQRMANRKQETSGASSSSATSSNPVALDLTQASTSSATVELESQEADQSATAACNLCNRHCAELMVHLHYSGCGTNSGLITMDMSDHSPPSPASPHLATAVLPTHDAEDEDAIFHDSVEDISESDCFQSAAENVSQMDDASSDARVSASAERDLAEAEDALIDDETAPFVMSIGSLSVDNTSEDEGERERRHRRSSDTSHESSTTRPNRARSRIQRSRVSDSVLRAMAEELRLQKEEHEDADQEMERVPQPRVKKRYMGHRNSRTMIKEATFWGNDFVMSGSDCGHIFIWDKETCDLVMIMEADHHVVNCLQPHPFDPILASSGIDYDIKLWAPLREEPFFDAEKAAEMIKRNEVMLEETKDTITVPATFMIRMLASLNHLRSAGGRIPGWTTREGRTDDH